MELGMRPKTNGMSDVNSELAELGRNIQQIEASVFQLITVLQPILTKQSENSMRHGACQSDEDAAVVTTLIENNVHLRNLDLLMQETIKRVALRK